MPRRILIVDATATNRIALKAMLGVAGYETRAVSQGQEGLEALASQTVDAIVVDVTLPDMRASDFCAHARAVLGDAAPPILMMIENGTPEARLDALRAGATALVSRPVQRPWLLTHLRALLRASETRAELRRRSMTAARIGFAEDQASFATQARVAIVSSDPLRARQTARRIRSLSAHKFEVLTPMGALMATDDPDRAPEVFMLCCGADAEDNLTLLSELRTRRDTKRAGIVVEYTSRAREYGARALDQGASDLVRDDALPDEVLLHLDRQLHLKRQADALRASVEAGLAMAAHDSLTGLFNRRYAMRYLEDLARQARETGRPYGLLVLDVDHFKAINDARGHAAGDMVLTQIARRLSDSIRDGDLLARIGGEEFLVALPSSSDADALAAAERLRRAVSAAPVPAPDGSALPITVSVGAACGSAAPERMLALADAALYRAKDAGRNCVIAADPVRAPKTERAAAAMPGEAPLRDTSGPTSGRVAH
ncbi:diguanylate cyclase [Maribius pontilimi]|uniref:diguanylate cyclase n=1 Tax=Palleronia pontilimi TaxID=1964209 RepID=A0A934MAB8_9RHOB|nr:diguanylate cyclase [Palleronia pontilimi]MBJ3763442.1 diguanylate cyclase [Palleronia pontilimi]